MRSLFAFLMIALAAGPARAHFIFLIPSSDQKSAKMVFSDTLGPDEGVPITKAAKTKLFALDADGKTIDVKMTEQKHHYDVTVSGKSPFMIGGVCEYGVLNKKGDPYLLMYYPKTVLVASVREDPTESAWMNVGSKRLPLDIVKGGKGEWQIKVLFKMKPLPGAEATVLFDAEAIPDVSVKTDAAGEIDLASAMKAVGRKDLKLIGIRVKHVENKSGEFDGKKYTEVRHYATIVVRQRVEKDEKEKSCDSEETAVIAGDDKKADPAATKLLADARMARAVWHKFPGFSAMVDINEDGRTLSANLVVSAEGRVTLDAGKGELDDKTADLLKKVKGEISSLVSHRLPGGPSDTPCAFTDAVKDHPQGRLITVLNDELHSSYRIRDRQILEVNRSMGPAGRFTITVLENTWTKEKTCLPVFYVVNSWDKGGMLKGSSTHRSEYVRMGAFDLPKSATTASASATGLSVRAITFHGHKLAPVSSARR